MAKGFTLVEVLIALFIAAVAAISIAQIIATTNKVIAAGRTTFIATNIAHEGLELSRAFRDNAWFTSQNRLEWLSLSGICPEGETGTVSYSVTPQDVSSGVVGDQANNTVELNGLSYHRTLQADCEYANIVPEVGSDSAFVTITSTVTWDDPSGGRKNISLKERLYNWLPAV